MTAETHTFLELTLMFALCASHVGLWLYVTRRARVLEEDLDDRDEDMTEALTDIATVLNAILAMAKNASEDEVQDEEPTFAPIPKVKYEH